MLRGLNCWNNHQDAVDIASLAVGVNEIYGQVWVFSRWNQHQCVRDHEFVPTETFGGRYQCVECRNNHWVMRLLRMLLDIGAKPFQFNKYHCRLIMEEWNQTNKNTRFFPCLVLSMLIGYPTNVILCSTN